MGRLLSLSRLIDALLLCLLIASFSIAQKVDGSGAPSTGQKKYYTSRTLKGAGLDRKVELVCDKMTISLIGC